MENSIRNTSRPRQAITAERRIHPLRAWLLGGLYLVALIPLAFAPKVSGNVSSRYMTIEALVERGTLAVDASPMRAGSGSPDLVRFGRHLYSDKPPVLSAIGAVVYAVLYESGVRFTGSANQYVVTNWILVVSVVGIASALCLVWLRQLLQWVPIPPWAADLLTLGFGFGSLLLTYGVTFNNHSIAAGLITGGLSLTILPEHGSTPSNRRQWGAGFLAGLAATIDLPAGGVLLAALGIWWLLRGRRIPWPLILGAAVPLLFHCVLQSMITGTPLPAEMYPEAFEYPGSYWTTAGVWKETGPRWQFGLELLFGPQGWLTVTPVLLLAVFGLASTMSRQDDPLRPAAFAVAGMTAVLLLYYIWGVRRTDYAGQSFGTRHLLAVTPACYLFAVAGACRLQSRSIWAVFILLMMVGTAYATAGIGDPWSRIEQRAAREPLLSTLQQVVIYPWSSYHR